MTIDTVAVVVVSIFHGFGNHVFYLTPHSHVTTLPPVSHHCPCCPIITAWATVAVPRLVKRFPEKSAICRNIVLLIVRRIPTDPALDAVVAKTVAPASLSSSSLGSWVVVDGGERRDSDDARTAGVNPTVSARESKAWEDHDALVSGEGADTGAEVISVGGGVADSADVMTAATAPVAKDLASPEPSRTVCSRT